MKHIDNHDDAVFDQRNGVNASVLVEPGKHFCNPWDVVNADHLSQEDKRAILASWASDLYVVESRPALCLVPGLPGPILYDDVLSALKCLDHPQSYGRPH
jgi:hypothetical protein